MALLNDTYTRYRFRNGLYLRIQMSLSLALILAGLWHRAPLTVPPSSHGVAPARAQVDRERAYVYNTP